tara:strand:+ start:359 stop:574 length:216 start_codon:yes stop_codon:yes gene_type:complete
MRLVLLSSVLVCPPCVDCGGFPVSDLTGDGRVDGEDVTMLVSRWGDAGHADLNGDGLVGACDLSVLLSEWD